MAIIYRAKLRGNRRDYTPLQMLGESGVTNATVVVAPPSAPHDPAGVDVMFVDPLHLTRCSMSLRLSEADRVARMAGDIHAALASNWPAAYALGTNTAATGAAPMEASKGLTGQAFVAFCAAYNRVRAMRLGSYASAPIGAAGQAANRPEREG